MTRRPWLILTAIFLAGAITGGCLVFGLLPSPGRPPGFQQMKKHWMEHLTNRLKLTADQQTRLQPIISQAEAQMQSLHREEVARAGQIIDATNSQIVPLLTPPQRLELEKMDRERRRMFSGHLPPPAPPAGSHPAEGGAGRPPAP